MILLLIVASGVGAILVSEILGRGKVVYTRMAGLIGSYVVCCAASATYLIMRGGTWLDGAAVALSVVPIMAAWLGFRIHISNSITLEMATFLSPDEPKPYDRLAADYGLDEHAARRLEVLQDGGYLTADEDMNVIDSPKSRLILKIMAILCGPTGPRSVAAGLAKKDARESRAKAETEPVA